jgi:hypothetical protein
VVKGSVRKKDKVMARILRDGKKGEMWERKVRKGEEKRRKRRKRGKGKEEIHLSRTSRLYLAFNWGPSRLGISAPA